MPFICTHCDKRCHKYQKLSFHIHQSHPLPKVRKSVYKRKKRDPVKSQEQRKSAAAKSRQRIPRSRWPALIASYEAAFDKIQWAKDNGIKSSNPYRLIKNWKDTSAKEEEELN